jgi:tetratricopeptide (TPR) repeat protein
VLSCLVRRYVIGSVVLALAAAAGAVVYILYATDHEYVRLIAAGDQAVNADEPFQALEAYSGAIAVRPEAMLAHLKRGMVYRSRGELVEALRDLRRAAELDPMATRPAELLGDTQMSLQRYEQAAFRYRDYLDIDDRSARVWYKLALAQYRAGHRARAIASLERALALEEGLAEVHLLMGLCLRDAGNLSAARLALEAATRQAPGLVASREALADLYHLLGEQPRAIDQLEALAALDPNHPQRLVSLGLAYARSRRFEAAILTLSRAVERFPDKAHVYAALGAVWLEAAMVRNDGEALNKAVEALSTAAGHSDVTSEALTDLARALLLAGDPFEAERVLRQAIERLPVHPDAYLQLAGLARRSNRTQEARDALVRYATLMGDAESVAAVATQIAAHSIALGDATTALRWIERADDGGITPELTSLRERAERIRAAAISPPPPSH